MADRRKVVTNTTVHLPLSAELQERLSSMAEGDHRKKSDLLRLLIDQEWERRQKSAQQSGAAA